MASCSQLCHPHPHAPGLIRPIINLTPLNLVDFGEILIDLGFQAPGWGFCDWGDLKVNSLMGLGLDCAVPCGAYATQMQ